jgi:hypothetical protein
MNVFQPCLVLLQIERNLVPWQLIIGNGLAVVEQASLCLLQAKKKVVVNVGRFW